MIKNISRSRKDYHRACRLLRLDINIYDERSDRGLCEDAWDCALLSNDMQSAVFVGWICYERMLKFYRQRPPSPAKFRFPFK